MSRISPAHYAIALLDCLANTKAKDEHAVLASFIEIVKKNGDWAQREKIQSALEWELRKRAGKSLVRIQSARPLTKGQKDSLAKLFKGEKTDVAYDIDESLIAGVRIAVNDSLQYDASAAKMISRIFS